MKPKKGMTARKIVQLIEQEIGEADRLYEVHARNGNEVGMQNCGFKRHDLSMLLWQIAEPSNEKRRGNG